MSESVEKSIKQAQELQAKRAKMIVDLEKTQAAFDKSMKELRAVANEDKVKKHLDRLNQKARKDAEEEAKKIAAHYGLGAELIENPQSLIDAAKQKINHKALSKAASGKLHL